MTYDVARLASGLCNGVETFIESDAAKAFTPGSRQLRSLPDFPQGIPILAIAASVKVNTSLFGGYVSQTIADGADLVVSEDSALAQHHQVGNIGGELVINCGTLHLITRVPAEMLCWHGSMTNDVQFRTEILKTITKIRKQDAGTTGIDRAALWRTWQKLNDVCRGTSGPSSDRACAEREVVQKRHALASSEVLLTAWRKKDLVTLRSLTHADNAADVGRQIPEDLMAFTPSEQKFDCRYDKRNLHLFGCYIKVARLDASLYFNWDIDYDRGWLVRGYVPDV